jgi:NADH dehydrogenase
VVGGGPTGVEYAGALAELARLVIPREYPELAGSRMRVVLVEGQQELLPSFPRGLGAGAHRQLQRRGIEVRTGLMVVEASERGARLSNGEEVGARTLVWAAGVKPAPLASALDAPRSRRGRLEVDRYLRVPGHANVFAAGDVAAFVQDGEEAPMLSAPAMQEGRAVARNILAAVRGESPRPFRYRDRGAMAVVGRNHAVAQLRPLHITLTGFAGWITWLLVHLFYLVGFRNRLAVMAGWAWNYVRLDRPVRIITRAKP